MQLTRNFWILIRHYVSSLKNEYPHIQQSLLIHEIIYNLLFSYVNLEVEEREAIEDHSAIMYMINIIGGLEYDALI